MIVLEQDGGLLLVPQRDHARMSARFADGWAWPVPRADDTQAAARLHDEGWREWDASPKLAPDGRPFTYRSTPDADYLGIWRRGFSLAWMEGEWIGLLVSLHGTPFLAGRPNAVGRSSVLAEERALQASALDWLGHAQASPDALPQEVRDGFRLLRAWDALSLFLVERWDDPLTLDVPGGPARVSWDGADAVVDPWPWGEEPEFMARVAAHKVEGARFADESALHAAIEAGERAAVAWRLVPAPGKR